jgi:hypothetical protein
VPISRNLQSRSRAANAGRCRARLH